MNLEQTFSTDLENNQVLDRSVELLTRCDFRLRSREQERALFVRGRSRPISRHVNELPQEVIVEIEHGLVKISASVEPRGNKDHQQHVDLMMPVISALQRVIESDEDIREASAEIRQAHKSAGIVWTAGEIACLIALALVVLAAILGAGVWLWAN
jgi:hypothetical protein